MKILRINMSEDPPQIIEEALGKYEGLGGRGLTSAIISDEVPADCHPLGEENKLVIAPGLLSGTIAVNSGRLSVGTKSPLTGGIKEANSGGQGAHILAKLGYAALVLEGKPKNNNLYVVRINKDKVTITKDNSVKGLTNYQLMERFKKEYEKKGAMISIGSAGEMKMSCATVAVTDIEGRPTRHAGRGGVGAVMGAKGVKAIILDGSNTNFRPPKDPEKFKEANKIFSDGLRKHPVTGEALPAFGTNVLTNIINEAGAYPTFNFKQGRFDKAEEISGEKEAELETKRGGVATHPCHSGCVIRCSGIYVDDKGNFITKQPEYETIWANGGNCGISDLDIIAKIDRLADDYGIDTIELGATIGVAMEAGIIKFGDGEGAIKLVNEIGKGTHLGRILGNGAAVTGKVFGVERVPVVKGQALPAYDPRAVKGVGVTYATSPMGADHTAGYAVATNILKVGGYVDPLKPEEQVKLSRDLQIATAAIDCTGMCLFIAFAVLDQPETMQALIDLLNSFYGLSLNHSDVVELGKKVLKIEREFNSRAGFTNKDDRLPKFFRTEPFPPHNTIFDVSDEELDQLFNW